MNTLDWIIIVTYIVAMIVCSYFWGRGYHKAEDYYLGSRRFSWLPAGISVLATQSSAISFISIPAFVAVAENGGLIFLEYEAAVPVAMVFVAWLLAPRLRAGGYVSIYEYLEERYGPSIRRLIAAVFLVSRGLGAGVAVYATAIVLTSVLELPMSLTIVLIGVSTVAYDTLGGMRAVVYSDVIQMAVLVAGLAICILFAVSQAGGVADVLAALPAERRVTADMSSGLGDGAAMPFWAFIFGGTLLYMAYYGTDQSQAQRLLSTRSEAEAQKALLFNGYARLPLISLYVVFGVCLYALLESDARFAAAVASDDPDYLVPQFIVAQLPVGLRGLLVAALIAAAMSSIDSALNSLSAATIRDFLPRGSTASLATGRLVTVLWGSIITAFAFFVGAVSDTVIEAVNQIGSAFYSPVLCAFALGMLVARVSSTAIWCGTVCGVALNVTLWIGFPSIHWMWWNFFGAVCTTAVALLISLFVPRLEQGVGGSVGSRWRRPFWGLVAYSAMIVAVLLSWQG